MCNIVAYTDGTLVLSLEKTWVDVINDMNKKLELARKWFITNELNVIKTVYRIFGYQY